MLFLWNLRIHHIPDQKLKVRESTIDRNFLQDALGLSLAVLPSLAAMALIQEYERPSVIKRIHSSFHQPEVSIPENAVPSMGQDIILKLFCRSASAAILLRYPTYYEEYWR